MRSLVFLVAPERRRPAQARGEFQPLVIQGPTRYVCQFYVHHLTPRSGNTISPDFMLLLYQLTAFWKLPRDIQLLEQDMRISTANLIRAADDVKGISLR